MLKSLAFVFCLALIGQYADAALYRKKDVKPDDLKDHPGCYVSALKRVLAFGERASDNTGLCKEYICPEVTTEEVYKIADCPFYSEECVLVPGNPQALFPDCCAHFDSEKTRDGAQCYANA